MKGLLSALYSACVAAIIVSLLYLAARYVIQYPKAATIVLAVLMLTSFGTGLRSIIEFGVLSPLLKIANGQTKSLLFCPIVFLAGMLAAITIPWLDVVSDWGIWSWIASLGFTLFNFETFYALVSGTFRVLKADNEIESE